MVARIFNFVKQYHTDIVLALIIVCISIISFNVGRMSVYNRRLQAGFQAVEPLNLELSGSTAKSTAQSVQITVIPRDPRVVASKASSSRVYHFLDCSGASRIAEKNKIYFPDETAAIAAGYSLAGNCQK